jgi:hypothetical protein
MPKQMKRGRSQVIWRYAPGAIYRYNETGGWCQSTEVTQKDSASLTGALAQAISHVLRQWNAIGQTAYPDPIQFPGRYSAGEPYYVTFNLWPLVFTCRVCGAVHFYRDPGRAMDVNPNLRCRSCKVMHSLRQVPYGMSSICWRVQQELVLPG